MILQAFYEANVPKSTLILIGSQPTSYYRELMEMNAELQSHKEYQGKVEIFCGITRQQVIQKYNEADTYVCASGVEVMSISLCEAAAAGMTILTTNVGHASLIPGVVIFEDEMGCVGGMKYFAAHQEERKWRGEKSYKYALQHYKMSRKIEQIEKLLLEVTEK